MSALKLAHAEDCPEIERHTGCPSGYVAWHHWAAEMAKKHRQTRCPVCGFWCVWVPLVKPRKEHA